MDADLAEFTNYQQAAVERCFADLDVAGRVSNRFVFDGDRLVRGRIITDLDTWQNLIGPGAAAYVNTLAGLAAGRTSRQRDELLAAAWAGTGPAINTIGRFANMIAEVMYWDRPGPLVTLDFPADRFILDLTIRDAEQVIAVLAPFTVNARAVARAAAETRQRLQPQPWVKVSMRDDGFTLDWWEGGGRAEHRFTSDGRRLD